MKNNIQTLYYIHDPMCSWCWAFRPVWLQLQAELKHQLSEPISIQYLLGGLAADTDLAMPPSMQKQIQRHWQVIGQRVRGTQFNFDFWIQCEARRSTYPACRAVIAARGQGIHFEQAMIFAIQQAYYLEACNPSDDAVLLKIAAQLALQPDQFYTDFYATETKDQLQQEIKQSQSMGCAGFPSLILNDEDGINHNIGIDYNHTEPMFKQISAVTHHES
ncbi:MAG: DsbA family protein [Mariprofundus sp.]|nr:DsbA family protein [Mariprofundus sp.]